jgi:hypothetical protein
VSINLKPGTGEQQKNKKKLLPKEEKRKEINT